MISLFGEERIGPNPLVSKTLLGAAFSNRGLHVQLKRQVCLKVVNNYRPYPKVLTKPMKAY